MSKPTVLSLFSGIGGFDLGLERAGFDVIGQVEIDPFCNQILAAHWPEVRRYGDVRSISAEHTGRGSLDGRRWLDSGSSGSRAGNEAAELHRPDLICGGFPCQDLSVAGKRAGLAGERSGLWFEFYRILSELRPAACLIENVPGLLSSNNGRDFGVILNGLEQLWPGRWGWAVLDSQHFGVPQRRRRLYVIAGPRRERIAQILSLCEGGDWHPQKGRKAGEGVAYALNAGVRGTGDGHGNAWNSNYIPAVSRTLGAATGRGEGGGGLRTTDLDGMEYIVHGLTAEGFDASEDGTGRGTPLIAAAINPGHEGKHSYAGDGGTMNVIASSAAVRRLTPVECERLQGFPDDWTRLDDRTPDGPRYRALGNAVTVPVIEYIGLRLREVL